MVYNLSARYKESIQLLGNRLKVVVKLVFMTLLSDDWTSRVHPSLNLFLIFNEAVPAGKRNTIPQFMATLRIVE